MSGHLTQLGNKTEIPQGPDAAVLETFQDTGHTDVEYLVRLNCPEFTSLCPVTGQPDFAQIIVDYVPRDLLIESKSFKLFMGSYRNHAAFHEATALDIGERLRSALSPIWMRVGAYFYPRGGIPIDVFWQTGIAPRHLWVPDQGITTYRAQR